MGRMHNKFFAIGLLLLGLFPACSSIRVRPEKIPTVKQARSLRGMPRHDVEQKLGLPNDTDAKDHAMWFLSEEPEGHPSPQPKPYELMFGPESEGAPLLDLRPAKR